MRNTLEATAAGSAASCSPKAWRSAAIGGAPGLALGAFGVRGVDGLSPGDLRRLSEIGLHGPVLAFAIRRHPDHRAALRPRPGAQRHPRATEQALFAGGRGDAGERDQRARSVLVVSEIALGPSWWSPPGSCCAASACSSGSTPGFMPKG